MYWYVIFVKMCCCHGNQFYLKSRIGIYDFNCKLLKLNAKHTIYVENRKSYSQEKICLGGAVYLNLSKLHMGFFNFENQLTSSSNSIFKLTSHYDQLANHKFYLQLPIFLIYFS